MLSWYTHTHTHTHTHRRALLSCWTTLVKNGIYWGFFGNKWKMFEDIGYPVYLNFCKYRHNGVSLITNIIVTNVKCIMPIKRICQKKILKKFWPPLEICLYLNRWTTSQNIKAFLNITALYPGQSWITGLCGEAAVSCRWHPLIQDHALCWHALHIHTAG